MITNRDCSVRSQNSGVRIQNEESQHYVLDSVFCLLTTEQFHHFLFFLRGAVTELANKAGVLPHAVNVELNRLVKKDMISRYAHGKYGLPDVAQPEDLLSLLDTGAYLTGFYALYRHNLITQVPAVITCFTNRRHARARIRKTPLGAFVFSCVGKKIYHFPEDGRIVSPEQAFFDWIYISLRQGLRPETQATLRNLSTLRTEVMAGLRVRYPKSVVAKAGTILS